MVRRRFFVAYQRYVILARPLDEPLPNNQPQLEVTIRQATLDDTERFRPIIPSWQLEQFVHRLRDDHIFFITLLPDGRIVNYRWLSPELSTLESYHIPLEPGDIYSSFAYSLPAYRRLGLSGANFAACCRFLREHGYKRVLTRVEVNNIASLAACQRVGFQEMGRATLFKLLGRTVRRYTPRRQQR
jgi:RimJ/RimL family protein N-acetyltransferase